MNDATRVEFNNYLNDALPYNTEKNHVSEKETRSGVDSTDRSAHQATAYHQNC